MSTETKIQRTTVPDSGRVEFLPDRFGLLKGLTFEGSVFVLADMLAPDSYGGGHWEFYVLDNRGWFLAPGGDSTYNVVSPNGSVASVGAEAFGIIVTLFAMNGAMWNAHLSTRLDKLLAESYDGLRDYAAQHTEAPAIFAAID